LNTTGLEETTKVDLITRDDMKKSMKMRQGSQDIHTYICGLKCELNQDRIICWFF